MKPLIGITMGDPAGIGPEILLKASVNRIFNKDNSILVFGDASYLKKVQSRFPTNHPVRAVAVRSLRRSQFISTEKKNISLIRKLVDQPRALVVLDFENLRTRMPVFGRPTSWGGRASGDYIAAATYLALDQRIDAIVTLPINKVSFRLGGWGKKFIGHTEMLASLTKTKKFALMLATGALRSVHVTQHIPLKNVPAHITRDAVSTTITLTHDGLRKMGIRIPRIAVCGLNPHAGDSGLMGKEEIRIISPAIQLCRRKKIHVDGPFSADTVWPRVIDGEFDAGIAMYHDQGQIAVKMMSFRNLDVTGVNVTLGLPIVRTSVAHGTAFDIAGKGIASEKSLLEAISFAGAMCRGRNG